MLIFETETVCLLHLFLVDTDIRLDAQKVLCHMTNFLVVLNSVALIIYIFLLMDIILGLPALYLIKALLC